MRNRLVVLACATVLACGRLMAAEAETPKTGEAAETAKAEEQKKDGAEEDKAAKDKKAAEAAAADQAAEKSDENAKDLTIRGESVKSDTENGGTPYLPKETTGFLKVPTELSETPASVQVITPELVEDQDDLRLKDALKNVAGVAQERTESYAQEFETAFVRGFTQRLYRSGLRTLGTDTVDMTTVERVEVIKGPDSITYGDAEPGGIINVVTKGAKLTPYMTKIRTSYGTDQGCRTSIDTGGSISAANDKAFRLSASYNNWESFRDYVEGESYSIAPAFYWDITRSTSLDIRANIKHEERTLDPGVVLDANNNFVMDLDTFLGDPDADGLTLDDSLVDATVQHSFAPWLGMRTRVVHHDFENQLEALRLSGSVNAAGTIARYYDESSIRIKETAASNDFLFKFGNDKFSDNLVLGGEVRHVSKNWNSVRDTNTADIPRISILDPVYGINVRSFTLAGDDDAEVDAAAIYLQNTLSLLDDKLQVMCGGRFDNVHSRDISTANVKNKGAAEDTTWQFGLLYKLLPHLYPYATASTSFNPQGTSTVDANGNYLEPETGIQYEAGFKSPFFDDKFTITNSVYRIDKENVAITDPNNTNFKINAGELRSCGYEFTAQGDFLPNWRIFSSYAYTDTEVIESSSLPVGSRFRGIPLNSGSLWLVHTWNEGKLRGVRMGSGIFAMDKRMGDDTGSFYLPGYATVEMMAGYKKDFAKDRSFDVQLNLHNLLDKEYYESSRSTTSIMPGAPLGATLSLGFTF